MNLKSLYFLFSFLWLYGSNILLYAESRFIFLQPLSFGSLLVSPDFGGAITIGFGEQERGEHTWSSGEGILRLSGGHVARVRYIPKKHGEIIILQYHLPFYLDKDKRVRIKAMQDNWESVKNGLPPYEIEIGATLEILPGYDFRKPLSLSGSVPVTVQIVYE